MNRFVCIIGVLFIAYVAVSAMMIHNRNQTIIEQEWDLKRVGWGEMQLQDEVARLYNLEDSLGIVDYERIDSLLWYQGDIDLDAIIREYSDGQ